MSDVDCRVGLVTGDARDTLGSQNNYHVFSVTVELYFYVLQDNTVNVTWKNYHYFLSIPVDCFHRQKTKTNLHVNLQTLLKLSFSHALVEV